MGSLVEQKIEEIYQVALKLGMVDNEVVNKSFFKNLLRQIAITAIDEVRDDVGYLLHQSSLKYVNNKED